MQVHIFPDKNQIHFFIDILNLDQPYAENQELRKVFCSLKKYLKKPSIHGNVIRNDFFVEEICEVGRYI